MQTYKDKTRNVNITIRSYPQEREFIDYAAKIAGKTRSDFMLEAATQKAQDILLDQCHFSLDEAQWQKFIEVLDHPPEPGEALKKLMSAPAPWK